MSATCPRRGTGSGSLSSPIDPPARPGRSKRPATSPVLIGAVVAAAVLSAPVAGDEAPRACPGEDQQATNVEGPAPGRSRGRRSFPARADSMVRERVEQGELPGAALVVIDGGEVVLARGYGVADLEDGRRVSPGTTRFSVGSVSKLVTALAVLQLVDAGRLSLDDAVAHRAAGDFLPPGPGDPVTVHHLLTHTSGLEPAHVGLVARSPPGANALRRHLATEMPARVRPPGRLYVYSQFGFGLAGLIVSGASGQPFARYVERRIFEPLGMEASSFRHEALSGAEAAEGYYLDGGETIHAPTAYHRIPPAGGLVTTPLDLARLAAALLSGGGRSDSVRVLPPRLVRRMFARQWSPHPRAAVEGTAYGLFEHRACGLRSLTTRGWVGGHSTYLHLVPDRAAGLVLMANSNSLAGLEPTLRRDLHRELSDGSCRAGGPATGRDGARPGAGDRGPGTETSPPAEGGRPAPADPSRLYGSYRVIGLAGRGVEALGRYFLAPQITVGPGPGGVTIDLGNARVPADPAGARLLRAGWTDGRTEHFSFIPDDRGEIGYMMWGGIAYEKVPPFRTRTAMATAAVALAVIFVVGMAAPMMRLVSREERSGERGSSVTGGWRRVSSVAVSALGLLFAGVMVLHLGTPERYRFAFGVPGVVRPALWIPFVMLLVASGLTGGTVLAWVRGEGSRSEKVVWSLVGAGGLLVGAAGAAVGLPPL